MQSGFSPPGEAGGNFEGEPVDDDPLQLRCVLEIANTGEAVGNSEFWRGKLEARTRCSCAACRRSPTQAET